MDSLDLLAREDEFKKLNKQLEKKTESLMKEIEHVMQKQDFFADFSHSLTFSTKPNTKKHCCDSPKITTPEKTKPKPIKKKNQPVLKFENGTGELEESCANLCTEEEICANECTDVRNKRTNEEFRCRSCTRIVICDCCTEPKSSDDMEFLNAFVTVSVKEKVLPASFLKDRLSVEIICKFLSSKVKLMQEQMDRLQNVIDNKATQCKAHMTKLAELEGERMSLITKTNNFKAVAGNMKAKCGVLENKLNEKDRLYKEQRSEADKLSAELKKVKKKNISVEARCASQEEIIDNLKQQLETAKRAEKGPFSMNLSWAPLLLKILKNKNISVEARCASQEEVIDNLKQQLETAKRAEKMNLASYYIYLELHQGKVNNLKQQLETAKRAEKEFRDSSRSLSASHQNTITRLEARMKSLTSCIEKQKEIIENLRKQNAVLSTEGAMKILEREYSNFLTQD